MTKKIQIPVKELLFHFSRSSGKGGQNVNKVNTKVTLEWKIESSEYCPNAVKERFIKTFSRYINKEQKVCITSQRFRNQARNIADCTQKLYTMLEQVWAPPKKRKPTKPSKASKEKRLKQKKIQSTKKQSRKKQLDSF